MNPDLTPIATEQQLLRAACEQSEVDALLELMFAAAGYHPCTCGAMLQAQEARCWPCSQANRDRGPIYGASLARGRGAE